MAPNFNQSNLLPKDSDKCLRWILGKNNFSDFYKLFVVSLAPDFKGYLHVPKLSYFVNMAKITLYVDITIITISHLKGYINDYLDLNLLDHSYILKTGIVW